MYTLGDPNIFNIATPACSTTAGTSSRRSAPTPRSGNCSASASTDQLGARRRANRLLFQAYFAATRATATKSARGAVRQFRQHLAGYVARNGVLIRHDTATNENDVLDEFFKTGRIGCTAAETASTSGLSMDNSKASN
jgi:hypothetical protein